MPGSFGYICTEEEAKRNLVCSPLPPHLVYIGPPFAELIHWASEVAAKQRKYFMMSRPKIKPVGGHYSRMFISYVVQTSVLIGDQKFEIGYGG